VIYAKTFSTGEEKNRMTFCPFLFGDRDEEWESFYWIYMTYIDGMCH